MKPVPTEPSDLVPRLRQQLILAQVRIMELEDERDALKPRLAELEQLVPAAQSLADRKLDEASHLEKVLAGRTAQWENLEQAHRLAGQELESTRAALADATSRADQAQASAQRLESALRVIDAELSSIKSSRSWRWTAWLRSGGGKSADPSA
ncbi:MAG: hypothetical protein Q8J74_06930 [Candidatus Didemnitutus sp.]|nr:hypothetical protein [Candidatus Didemnitutus sp.]